MLPLRGLSKLTATLASMAFASHYFVAPGFSVEMGSPIQVNLNTQAVYVNWNISTSSLEDVDSWAEGLQISVTSTGAIAQQPADCLRMGDRLACRLTRTSFQALATQGQVSIVGMVGPERKFTWPTTINVVDSEVLSKLEIEDGLDGSHLTGVDPDRITLTIKARNLSGAQLPALFSMSKDGELASTTETPTNEWSFSLSASALDIGENTFEFLAENEFGEISQSFSIVRELPALGKVRIDSPKDFFPVKDGYLDFLSFTVDVPSASDRTLRGKGNVTIFDSKNKSVFVKQITKTGTQSFIYKPTAPARSAGKHRIVVVFQPTGGSKKTSTATVVGSPQKMTVSSGSITVAGWAAKNDCGSSYAPCEKGSNSGSPNGIGLYNDVIDLDHESYFSVNVPNGTFRWKVSFGGFWNGINGPSFNLTATDSSFGRSFGYIGSTPQANDWSGTWGSSWATIEPSNKASWKMSSDEWGYIYFRTVTIQYQKRTLN